MNYKTYVFRVEEEGFKNRKLVKIKEVSKYAAKQRIKRMGHVEAELIRVDD